MAADRPDKRRISILVSILISYSIVALAAGGIGWLSFHRQAQTIGIVTSLYNRAFEGANNAHWAYNKFQHAQLLWREGSEKAREEASLWVASIKEHLALANDFVFTQQEAAMIAGIREHFEALDMENAHDVEALDRDMRRLVQ